MNPKLQSLRHYSLLILFCFGAICMSAQNGFNQLYPTLNLISANENTNSAVYKVSKGGVVFRLSVGINGNNAGFVIQTQANGIIGQGTATLNGTCPTISIANTRKGLLDIWQLAVDRVIVQNNSLALLSLSASNNEALLTHLCEEKCDQDLESAITVDNQAKSQPFYAVISVGNGTCDGYEPCTQEALQDYNDCVCECVEDSKK